MKNHFGIKKDTLKRIAEKTETPVYIYDENLIQNNILAYQKGLRSDIFETEVVYASKAFMCTAMVKIVHDMCCSLDVVSGGEIYCAVTSGFAMENVYFHGNNKTPREIEEAFRAGVGTFIVDNPMELACVKQKAESMQKKMKIMLRVNPGVEAHTHKYIVTAHPDSKFGTNISETQEIISMIEMIDNCEYLRFDGLHAHIGSQIFEKKAFIEEIDVLCSFVETIEKQYHYNVGALNLGGGFAAYYTDEDRPIPIEEVCTSIISEMEKQKLRRNLSTHRILVEPGRSIVAEAGVTLYTVGYTKKTPNKKYVFVDGGMSDNIRPALYNAKYCALLLDDAERRKTETVTIAGKCCESGDVIIEDCTMPELKPGDLLLVYSTGAYGYSMASNYNRIPKAEVVFVKDQKARTVIKRETYKNLQQNETNEEIL